MARLSRIVIPDIPHHVTQRGNRRQKLFAEPGDYALYRDLLAERCEKNGVSCWAYCLLPNHIHLILTPTTLEGLSRAVGEAHRRYTAFVNARARVTGGEADEIGDCISCPRILDSKHSSHANKSQ